MRSRTNYGVIGSVVSITAGSAGFFASMPDYYVNSVAGNWPIVLPTFPTAYASLISSFSGTKYYINGVIGNDSNSGLAPGAPFKTFNQFVTVTNTTNSSIMAVIYPGTYSITPVTGSQAGTSFYDNGYDRRIVGYPGQVTFQWTDTTGNRDATMCELLNASSAVYGIIFKRDNNGRTANYQVAYFKNNCGIYYNCVFQETNANADWALAYSGFSNSGGKAVNYCTIAQSNAGLGDYNGSGITFTSCFFNYTYTSSGETFTSCQIGSLHNLNFTTYKAAEATTSGVAYGTYAWP